MTTSSGIDTGLGPDDAPTLDVATRSRAAKKGRPVARPPGIGLQFFAMAALLLAVTLGLTVLVAAVRSVGVAERSIRRALAQVPVVWEGWRSARATALQQQLTSLAAEPGTKAIFGEGLDVATRHQFAVADAASVLPGAGTIFLFDRHARVLARSDRSEGKGLGQDFAGVDWVAGPLDTWKGAVSVVRERGQLALVVAVPVVSGIGSGARLDGVLAATFPIGEPSVTELQSLTRGEVAVVADMARVGAAPEPRLSVATAGFGGAATAAQVLAGDAVGAVFYDQRVWGPVTVRGHGGPRLALAVPVVNARGETLGSLLVSRSRSEEMAAFQEIRRGLVVAGVVMLLVALPVSFLLGRRVAGPLEELAAGAEAVREGHLDVTLPHSARGEVGVLAAAFGDMVRELREKQALERLLARLRAPSGDPTADSPTMPRNAVDGARLPDLGEVFASRFHLEAVLGRGGMAVVFRAHDLELEEDVAVKVLAPGLLAAEDAVVWLRQEVRLARRITHPNVVRVHDLVESSGLRCLTMEYVPGLTLRALITQHGALDAAPGLQVAKQLCRGLAAVHAAGIVHRDVKPQNVMVLPNGQVKLMDFGISWSQRAGTDADTVGSAAGTPQYMSPEQCLGAGADQRSDVYSLGIVLYEMFAGAPPFAAHDLATLVHSHLHAPPPQLAAARPELPPQLAELVAWCLAKDPAERPADVATVYHVLRELSG